jgi:alginate O-acetyltransferase complex protein AlgI
MLFNTPEFIFLFLPCAVAAHFILARWSIDAALIGTAISSLVFYALWNPPFLALPIASITLNFGIAHLIARQKTASRAPFVFGIAANLAVLGYFKYAGFIMAIIQGTTVPVPNVPLALSFTTFVQIAFLADVHRRRQVLDLPSYAVFVLFFPHLIAGSIVRWSNLGRQLREAKRYRLNWNNCALGLAVFTLGLGRWEVKPARHHRGCSRAASTASTRYATISTTPTRITRKSVP